MIRLSLSVAAVLIVNLVLGVVLEAQVVEPHFHHAIEIESAPIINRIPLETRQIRRIVEQPDGSLLITEWETGSLIRLSPEGQPERIAVGLNQPSGVVSSGSGEIFLTLYGAGIPKSGALVRLDSMGNLVPLIDELNGPSDLVMSPQGDLVFCEYSTGKVFKLNADGEQELLTDRVTSPTALAYDNRGTLYIASRTEGTVYQLLFDGTLERIQVGLQHPSDLFVHRSGLLIILNSQTGRIMAWNPETGKTQSYARVPAETTCLAFDEDDNFVIGHWNYNFLMRITRHLSVPCPHCEERIPLNLVPTATTGSPDTSL
ncbi:hypothetical protein OAF24_01250 [bacterium]|jgi:sugar lactone lactonase YvrE|nr:hypothetical protein [bacterium]MDB4786611.1 hypothetical protein [Planctomycetaceae bacterium]